MWVGLIQSVKGLESKSRFPKAKGILYQGYHVEILNFQPALQIWDLPAPTILPGKSHGWRSLVGCSPWGPWGSDTTEWLPFHFSLSCIGEGNGNPLQCSCLRIPGTGEPGGLPSLGPHRVGHDWSDLAAAAVCNNILSELSFNSWEFLLSASMYLLYVLSVTIRFPFAMAFNDAPFYANCQNIVTEPVLKTQR